MMTMLPYPKEVMAIADPDTPPSVNAVYIYEGLMETGDVGILVDYYLDYAVLPTTETATESYLVVFVDTDGTTQIRSVAPYTYVDSGYHRGVAWIYFSATDATTYSIDSADIALYRVWLVGNPTVPSGWAGDPPKTVATIDQWNTAGDMNVLLTLRVLYYADVLELEWTLDLVESTSLGNKLTALGDNYFENAIPNLRLMAPTAFPASTIDPTLEDIDYTTQFGAVLTDSTCTPSGGTGTVAGAPVDLAEGANNVNVTGLGTLTIELEQGTVGTATSDVCTVTGTPVDLVAGINTITTAGIVGNIIITVDQQDTTTGIEDSITGTGWDLTAVATAFGFSRWMFSGIIWIIMSVLICAAVYRTTPSGFAGGGSRVVMIVFTVCIVGGALLGLLKPVVAVLMFIAFCGFTGYILFFRGSSA
jgi:hypothetical protein